MDRKNLSGVKGYWVALETTLTTVSHLGLGLLLKSSCLLTQLPSPLSIWSPAHTVVILAAHYAGLPLQSHSFPPSGLGFMGGVRFMAMGGACLTGGGANITPLVVMTTVEKNRRT